MSKPATLLMITLILFFTLSCAARPDPSSTAAAIKVEGAEVVDGGGDESCEGVNDKEGCLERRTLIAHTDYIYSQSHTDDTKH